MKTLAIALMFVLLSIGTAIAHHGWAGYSDEEFEISGTVATPVKLAGAHGTMQIKVDNQVWDITLAPPAARAGCGSYRIDNPGWRDSDDPRASSSRSEAVRGENGARDVQREALQRLSRSEIVRDRLVLLEQSALGRVHADLQPLDLPGCQLAAYFRHRRAVRRGDDHRPAPDGSVAAHLR